MIIQTKSDKETQEFGKKFAKKISGGGVICLYGDLGAGKTTLVQGIARGLGIENRVISPTFILIRRYKIKSQKLKVKSANQNSKVRHLWHVDLYRLNDIEEAKAIGIEEIISDPNNIVLIEWPEKIAKLLPKKRYDVHLKQVGENKREIQYEIIH